MIYDTVYGTGTPAIRHNIKTGNQVPSDIMAEIDRKIDDGNPVGGTFQFSTYDGGGAGGTAPTGGAAGQCYNGTAWSAHRDHQLRRSELALIRSDIRGNARRRGGRCLFVTLDS